MWNYIMLQIARASYICMNGLTQLVSGYSMASGNSEERRARRQVYEKSAHVIKIKMKERKFELEGPELTHFMLRHESYTHPNVVLQPNATLMAIDKKYAIFAICNVDVLAHTTGPFMYINQFNHCIKLICLPLESFIRLAEEVGDPPGRLILLSNSGRCGSTLLTQLFMEIPNSLAISEPEVLMPFAHDALFADVPKERRLVLIRSCIRLLCKSTRIDANGIAPTILIKPKAHGISIAKELTELYPDMKHMYMYRHPEEYVRSLRTVYRSLLHPVARSLVLYISFGISMEEFIMRQFPREKGTQPSKYELILTDAIKGLNLHNYVLRFASLLCGNLLKMMQLAKEENIDFLIVSYHELKDETATEMKRIMQHCQIDVGEGFQVTLPERDSQKNSGLSQSHLKNFRESLTVKEIADIDGVLRDCGFPTCENFPLTRDGFVKALELS